MFRRPTIGMFARTLLITRYRLDPKETLELATAAVKTAQFVFKVDGTGADEAADEQAR